jgi:hypothetical protein
VGSRDWPKHEVKMVIFCYRVLYYIVHYFAFIVINSSEGKGKAFPLQALERPLGFQEVEAPEFLHNRHMKVVRLSALCTGRLYPQEGFLVLISVRG